MSALFENNAVSTLAADITAGATSLSVQSADAGLFPQPAGADDWFPVTVFDSTNMEIMRCTARSGATLTVTRAQEGTTALAFSAGTKVEHRLTAAALGDVASTILVGPSHPTSSDGATGDFFVSRGENRMFGPKAESSGIAGGMFGDLTPDAGQPSFGVEAAYGTRFQVNADGEIGALRFWRMEGDTTSSRWLRMWDDAGNPVPVTGAQTSGESGVGWQTVNLSPAFPVTAGSVYRVTYDTTTTQAALPATSTQTSQQPALTILEGCIASAASEYPSETDPTFSLWADAIWTPGTDPWPLALTGGAADAPNDGKFYGRRNQAWEHTAEWLQGFAAPSNSQGSLGDVYVQSGGNLYGPKRAAVGSMFEGRSPSGIATAASALVVGARVDCTAPGKITAIKFYRVPGDTTTSRTVRVYDGLFSTLATATTSGETGEGWQTVPLATPLTLSAGTVNVAYTVAAGQPYASTPLTPVSPGFSFIGGITGNLVPSTLVPGSNFWVDVVYETAPWPLTIPAGLSEAPFDNIAYVRRNRSWQAGVLEAPNDSIGYLRLNNAWAAGVLEAPNDGASYVRSNNAWTQLVQTGTWTPTWTNALTNPSSVVYEASSRYGLYWKLGNLVAVQGRIRTTTLTLGSASGQCIIAGLPFASHSAGIATLALAYASSWTTQAPTNLVIQPNSSGIHCYSQLATSMTAITQANYVTGAGNDVVFGGVYRSAS